MSRGAHTVTILAIAVLLISGCAVPVTGNQTPPVAANSGEPRMDTTSAVGSSAEIAPVPTRTGWVAVARADDGRGQAGEARRAIDEVGSGRSPVMVDGEQITLERDGGLSIDTASGTVVQLPDGTSEQIEVHPTSGHDFAFTVPGSATSKAASVGGVDVVYPAADGTSSAVKAGPNGEVQVLTTIPNSASPETFTYDFMAPPGTDMQLDSDTGAVVALKDGSLVFGVAPPWAVDAEGKRVPTHFEIDGTTLTQVVEHAAGRYAYPIVADPTVNSSMIASYKWVKSTKGWTISVAVTPWMAWVTITAAAADGWSELTRAVKNNSAIEYARLNTEAMRQQWNCHAAGKAIIGIAGWLGIDGRPTWDLETWRKTTSNPMDLVAKMCNW